MPTNFRFVFSIFVALDLLSLNLEAQKFPPFYEMRAEHDPSGTGQFFMGREVAHVCQGGEWLERSDREQEENVELMVDLLQLKPGDVVADIGAGTGYVSRKLAKRVEGLRGRVYAEEIQPEMLTILTNKAAAAGISNIVPVLGTVTDPRLPEASIDLAILVDVYHEFDRPYEMVQHIGKALKPGGRIVFAEYRAEDPKIPIKPVHKMTLEQVKKEMTVHPFVFVESIEKLPWQHLIIFRKGTEPMNTPREFNGEKIASLEDVLESKVDLWGQAAMRPENGPSFAFFEGLLPPLRYVNTAFRQYPIVLSAPGATNKTRFVSNGSAVNARAELPYVWKEVGTPVTFYAGNSAKPFGENLRKLTGPSYEKGYLPIVQLTYEQEDEIYEEEAFASTDSYFAQSGLLFVQFRLKKERAAKSRDASAGRIVARIDSAETLMFAENAVRGSNHYALVFTDGNWDWNPTNKTLSATLTTKSPATLAIATAPMAQPVQVFGPNSFEEQKKKCMSTWENILSRGARIETPEPYVNNAWRSLVIGIYQLLQGDTPNYSAGNQYERIYEAESGDTVRAALLFGQLSDAKKMAVPCLDYKRPGLLSHQAAFKLQLLAHYYWLTRDANFVREMQPRWSKEVAFLMDSREKESGLLPKEQYAGDIAENVYSLNSNANGSKGLRDMAAVLADMGQAEEAKKILQAGNALRRAALAAVDKSIFSKSAPAFIPNALFGYEKPYEQITDSKLGSYWNLMAPYILGSDLFGLNSDLETQLLNYMYERGGVCMGMIRFHQHTGLFANENGVDELYGLRLTDKLLQRDEEDRALVSFYGTLAQGFTRDTFIGAEGTSLRPLDEFGRPMYLPPNSSANALWLWTLRGLLLQDIDGNDDCAPDTLRLLFATPKAWLEDGKTIKVERAPTAFGEVSLSITSRLSKGEVVADVQPPLRNPPQTMLMRVRLPDGWKAVSASTGEHQFTPDEKGTIDITSLKDRFTIRIKVEHQ